MYFCVRSGALAVIDYLLEHRPWITTSLEYSVEQDGLELGV